MSERFVAACVQTTSGPDTAVNLDAVEDLIRQAQSQGAQLIMTPEMTDRIATNREEALAWSFEQANHPGCQLFSDLAAELSLWLLAGSFMVRVAEDRLANRSFLFAPDGAMRATYDKIHMFDVEIPDGQSYRESRTYQPGDRAVATDLPWGCLGLTICYDLRFSYLYRTLASEGADFLTVPSAFTRYTGEAHWHTLLRARAIETGCFIFAPAQCGSHAAGRQTFGHALMIDPWGAVLAEAGTDPAVILAEIDPAAVAHARGKIPALSHARTFEAPKT